MLRRPWRTHNAATDLAASARSAERDANHDARRINLEYRALSPFWELYPQDSILEHVSKTKSGMKYRQNRMEYFQNPDGVI